MKKKIKLTVDKRNKNTSQKFVRGQENDSVLLSPFLEVEIDALQFFPSFHSITKLLNNFWTSYSSSGGGVGFFCSLLSKADLLPRSVLS